MIAGFPERTLNRGVARRLGEPPPFSIGQSAFTLVEVMMGVLVLGIMVVSLYTGFAFGFAQIRLARENLRATQILLEKMEVVRLLNWDQVIKPSNVPNTFKAPLYADRPPLDFYKGTVQVTSAPLTETYANAMRMIQIQVSWKSGGVIRQRQMTTYVAQYGMQQYEY